MNLNTVSGQYSRSTVYCIAITSLLIGIVSLCPVRAQTPAPQESVRQLAKQLMDRDRLPSLSIAIGRDGKLVFAEAYGLADVENNLVATPQTVYRIGSISKTLTAVTAMRLAEQGTLNLNSEIQRYCSDFPSKGSPITVRELLAHLGGIRDYNYRKFKEEFLSAKRYETLADALTIFKDDTLVAKPGIEYHYSSFGYVLVGCCLEGASGDDYDDLVKSQIIDPAGMAQTRLDYAERIIPHRARGYGLANDSTWTNAVYVDLSDRFPAGGYLSTPTDLVFFGGALLDGRLLDKNALSTMWKPQHTADGESTNYGLGWQASDEGPEVYHGGTSVGSSAFLYIRRDDNIVVAFATNLQLWTSPRLELARQLADAFTQ